MKISSAEYVSSFTEAAGLPQDRPEVAFVGRSNVGKSSLINRLLGRKNLAFTSSAPGKTRMFNYYLINGGFYVVDLPGYGFAKTSKKERGRWGRLIGEYLATHPALRLVIHCIDSRHPPMETDEDVVALMRGEPVPYIIALTKSDKLSGNGRAQSVARVEKLLRSMAMDVPVFLTSAEDGRGRDDLLTWVGEFV